MGKRPVGMMTPTMLEVFTAQNHRISVPVLGPQWALEESLTQGQTNIICRLSVPGQLAFLTAQDLYIAEPPADLEDWLCTVRQAEYAQKYESVSLKHLEKLPVDGVVWLEASFELIIHARLAPMHKLERVALVDHHRLTLSAEASAKDLRKYWLEAQRWFDEVQFAALEQGN